MRGQAQGAGARVAPLVPVPRPAFHAICLASRNAATSQQGGGWDAVSRRHCRALRGSLEDMFVGLLMTYPLFLREGGLTHRDGPFDAAAMLGPTVTHPDSAAFLARLSSARAFGAFISDRKSTGGQGA